MLKPDAWIRKMCKEHKMIEPFVDRQDGHGKISYGLSSYGYDIRVADEYKIFTNVYGTVIDPKAFDAKAFVDHKGPTCIVPPNSFALARTVERFKIPRNVLAVCLGKSTYARWRPDRQRHAPGADVGRLPDARDFEQRRLCPPRSTPARASRSCCFSKAPTSAKSPTPTARAST